LVELIQFMYPIASESPVSTIRVKNSGSESAHGINLAINPEKTLRSGTVEEGANTAIQKDTVKAAVTEVDAMLMVREEGVHGQSPVG
jgi:hypothetical protein